MSDRYVPTAAGHAVAAMVGEAERHRQELADLDGDVRGLVDALRRAAHDDEWIGPERPTPEKVEAIATAIEAELPILTQVDARRLARTLRRYGLGPREERDV